MDAIALRDRLIDDYKRYVGGFIAIKEPRTKDFVDRRFAADRIGDQPCQCRWSNG